MNTPSKEELKNALKKELVVIPKTGAEPFSNDGKSLPFDVQSFWKWYASDLVINVIRGVVAEYIVAMAVGCADGVRKEWDNYDLKTADGIRIEVKSSAYIQSWSQSEFSPIRFGIAPTQGWDSATNEYDEVAIRRANIYVFCVLKHKDKQTIDPLNLNQWDFYIMTTKSLNKLVPKQKGIGLPSLLKLNPKKATYREIDDVIKQALREDD